MNTADFFAARRNKRRVRDFRKRVASGDRARAVRDWQNAATRYREALEFNPVAAPIWLQLGHALKEQGSHAPAEAAYRIAIALNGSDADAHLQLGHVLKLQAKYRDSAEAYAAAALADPMLGDAHRELLAIKANLAPAEQIALAERLDAAEATLDARSQEADQNAKTPRSIRQEVQRAVRREFDLGLSGPSLFADALGGLWDNFGQLHAQVQGIAEALRTTSADRLSHALEATASLERRLGELVEQSAHTVRRDELEVVRARIEFIRRELMYEFRSALLDHTQRKPPITPRIINTTKVVEALGRGMLRVNIGCGHVPIGQYVNVDARELPGVDVIADVTDLPFDDEAVAEIYSSHLLEHFPEEILKRVVLPHWRKKLRVGGLLRTVVPDADAMIKSYIAGEMPFTDLRDVTFGGQDYSGDFHYTMFTSEHIHNLLHDLGFEELVITAQGRTNGQCRELEIVGVRRK